MVLPVFEYDPTEPIAELISRSRDDFEEQGFVIFNNVLSPEQLDSINTALEPHLAEDVQGRNNFE
ncbi:MAG: hypothetical protein AAF197_01110, partial [Pseudomonadota bacterium]